MAYDIIGDIHGCAKTLSALLVKLNYELNDGIYTHETRQVIYLGDFIDRGPYQRKVIDIVRLMISAGSALAVMGNHEFNAIAYATFDDKRNAYCRKHIEKNIDQHEAFLNAYDPDSKQYAEVIAWFKTLPLWLELDGLNVVHACWDEECMNSIESDNGDRKLFTDDFIIKASTENTQEFKVIEILLKGKEVKLPNGGHFYDKENNKRHDIRIQWWDTSVKTYKEAFMGSERARTHIPDDEISGDHLIGYAHDAPPLFLGHYWMAGDMTPLAANVACLGYSVAKSGGKLVAYQWDGEQQLSVDNYISVDRLE